MSLYKIHDMILNTKVQKEFRENYIFYFFQTFTLFNKDKEEKIYRFSHAAMKNYGDIQAQARI